MVMKVYWKLTKLMPCEQYASLLLTENVSTCSCPQEHGYCSVPQWAIVQSQR